MREPGRVEEHLLDSDDVLAVRAELGNVFGDPVVERDGSFGEELPDCDRDECFRRRIDRVARLVGCRGVAEGDAAITSPSYATAS